jgi:hypothetical protein
MIVGLIVTMVSISTTGCGWTDNESRHTAENVDATFAESGLALLRQPRGQPGSVIINPGDAPVPEASFRDRRGLFYVLVYSSGEDADAIARSAPVIDPLVQQRREFLRKENVLAVVQPPDDQLRARIAAALDEL